jgi:hypothetical protein
MEGVKACRADWKELITKRRGHYFFYPGRYLTSATNHLVNYVLKIDTSYPGTCDLLCIAGSKITARNRVRQKCCLLVWGMAIFEMPASVLVPTVTELTVDTV